MAVTTGLGYVFIQHSRAAQVAKKLYRFAFRFPREIWFLNRDDQAAFVEQNLLVHPERARLLHGEGVDLEQFAFTPLPERTEFKFVLIGRALHLGERFNALPLIWPTLYKSVVFLVLLLVLNALEEVIVGFMHHRKVVDSLAEFGGGTLAQLTASSIVVLLILIPFFAFRSLGEVVGERNLVRVFFLQRHNTDAGRMRWTRGSQ